MGGTRAAAWPLIRRDLGLSYAEIGLVMAVPGLVGSALDPLVGAAADTTRRRLVFLAGGVGVWASIVLTTGATGFWTLLAALAVGYPASGAFVGVAQATLMDLEPERRERNMARWTLAGSFGYVGGPVLLASAAWIGLGWRGAIGALALGALPLLVVAARVSHPRPSEEATVGASLRFALGALRRREVVRWLVLLELADLLGDVFHGFLALYLVDVAGASPAEAALGVAVWTVTGLLGDWLLLRILDRLAGPAYLRATAALALAAYPAFLLAPGFAAKLGAVALLGLLNAGWYAIPKARLYGELHGRSGAAVGLGGMGGLAGALVPLALGLAAGGVGLGTTMWTLLAAPVALLVLVPRRGALR